MNRPFVSTKVRRRENVGRWPENEHEFRWKTIMHQPWVSVVMPVYDAERSVAGAISSVLDQGFKDFELVIVDDAARDTRLDICRAFDDPRIRIKSETGRGLARACDTGVMAARSSPAMEAVAHHPALLWQKPATEAIS